MTVSNDNVPFEDRGAVSISSSDRLLLMRFLDTVFPSLFPQNKPAVSQGGRGWCLALLLRSKPFYHAALALSACHSRTGNHSESSRATTLVQQEEHVELCVKLLRGAAANSCPKSRLSLVASIFLLMFFKVRYRYRLDREYS